VAKRHKKERQAHLKHVLASWLTVARQQKRKKKNVVSKWRQASEQCRCRLVRVLKQWRQMCKMPLTPDVLNAYIDERIRDLPPHQFLSKITDSTYDSVVTDYSSCMFTNLVHGRFTKTFVLKHRCADCGGTAEQRCHGLNEERPVLLRRALARVWPDTTQTILLRTIVIAFLEEHKGTGFTFKCAGCHAAEKKTPRLVDEGTLDHCRVVVHQCVPDLGNTGTTPLDRGETPVPSAS